MSFALLQAPTGSSFGWVVPVLIFIVVMARCSRLPSSR